MKLFYCEDTGEFTLSDFLRNNSESFHSDELADILAQLESLAVRESFTLNLGCSGKYSIKRIK